jgi:hypothetical protein
MPGFYELFRIPNAISLAHAIMRRVNINTFQKRMQLRGRDDDGVSAVIAPARRIDKGPSLETFLAQPEAALLPYECLETSSVTAKENETVSGIGILSQHVLHNQGERVDSTTHILVTSGDEDPMDGREADHPTSG